MAVETPIFSRLSKNVHKAFRIAKTKAIELNSKEIKLEHLFFGILSLKDSLASQSLESMGIDVIKTRDKLFSKAIADLGKELTSDPVVSQEVLAIVKEAYVRALKNKHVYVGTEHILLAILENNSKLSAELKESGLDSKKYWNHLLSFANYPVGLLVKPEGYTEAEQQNALTEFGVDLTEFAQNGKLDPLVGREDEIQRIIKILSRRRKNNPIIVGEAGVGKTALVEGLAQKVAAGEVPPSLKNIKIISIDISEIVAGSKMRGDMEEKFLNIIREVTSLPNVVIFIDEIHNILETGGSGGLDIAQLMKPVLLRGSFKVIGATTTSEYSRIFEEDEALNRRFQPVKVEETSKEDTVRILQRLKPLLEAHHQITISSQAVEEAVKLSDRYITDRFLPDKAIDLLDEATAAKRLSLETKFSNVSDLKDKLTDLSVEKDEYLKAGEITKASQMRMEEKRIEKQINKFEKRRQDTQKEKHNKVMAEDVRQVLSSWTNIPVTTLTDEETETLLNLDKILSERVIGQQEAVESIARAIKRSRVGITSKDRPLSSFLFLGPTGVGKTELARQLTKVLFGDERNLIQLDMSEFMEMHSVSKMIGSPPGYIGYKEGGQLTERVKQKPYSVILFDEIEKAHLDILNILLQILEYGHLTDSKGQKVSFKNTIIILTSNIGAEDIRTDKSLGFRTESDIETSQSIISKEVADSAYKSMKEKLNKKLKEVLRPELLNRLDDIVIFRSLSREDGKKIVKLLISDLNDRLVELNAKVSLDDKAYEILLTEGFSNEYGARPLRRVVQDKVETEVSEILLKERKKKETSPISVKVTGKGGSLSFNGDK